ncbi:MAG: AAA family ATPase, partial [Solirubrobacterales bacterium]|nr:AAA family ATPase [Solirubrobacterales bacterium]
MARTIAVLSQKGGTGKTTTVRTLTDAFRRSGLRVLAIDLDPQGNASTGLGLDRKSRRSSTYDVMSAERSLADVVH